ncbi:amino acid adenylation domain-containing protein [Catenovulum sp. SM1970]|uniref:non-ribosomal peptide synthetase n=1 Tax=Marinifaba aquimaris TaxID=2741323 RepID=UPI001573DA5E|nr:non-ribosomal peptide synthetase [Marinifaba aquimaris]NTS77174.1 amino acid adenylation domain-containing protein [Marinifaba aquimaris]
MMLELLKELYKETICIWVEEQELSLAFDDAPDEEVIDLVRSNKSDILAFLNEHQVFSQEDFEHLVADVSTDSQSIQAIYPATSLQQGFVYHSLSQPDDDAYRVQTLVDYHLALNIAHYQQAWLYASLKFPALRIAFDWEESEEILQIITSAASINEDNFDIVDISDLSVTDRQAAIEGIQTEDRKRGFDLKEPGLIRLTLIKQSEQLYTLLKTEHHSIGDGWSGPVLWHTVHQYYDQLQSGITPDVQPETAYLEAQTYYGQYADQTNQYWQNKKQQWGDANDVNALLSRQVDLSQLRTIEQPAEQLISIEGEQYLELKNMCREQGVTLNAALQFAWHKLIQSYTQDEQTIVGTTVSGRDIPVAGIEVSVGLYINTLPMMIDWLADKPVSEILQNIQQTIAELNSFSSMPLSQLQTGGDRLFHSLFVFENYPALSQEQLDTESISSQLAYRSVVEKMDYPLSLIAYEQGESLNVGLKYGEDWLSENQALRLLEQIALILNCISQNPQLSHQFVTPLSADEKHLLLDTWNDTCVPFPENDCLHHLFERQVEKTPDNIALVFNDEQLTYRALNEKANQLARVIQSQLSKQSSAESKTDTFVGLYLDRSLEMVISILAVLKAGAAYVPISVENPTERSQFILSDCATSVLICQQGLIESVERICEDLPHQPALVVVDQGDTYLAEATENLDVETNVNELAYVIYTSGTTGQPKGVMVPHSGVVNRLDWMQKQYPLTSGDRVLQKTPYSFDVSVWELLWANQVGACIVMAPPNVHKEPEQLVSLFNQAQITVTHFVPSMLDAFCQYLTLSSLPFPKSLSKVFCSGEALTPAHINSFNQVAVHQQQLHNLYGPTEASIDVSYFDNAHLCQSVVPIGKPIQNTQLYVLNSALQPVAIGAVGELYIAGVCLARGYLNRPELTANTFIANPFSNDDFNRSGVSQLYKTGDVVRWLGDGNIEYIGRNDSQVKINGLRIELAEIERVLSEYPTVSQAVVIDLEVHNRKALVAYIVSNNDSQLNADELSEFLRQRLPEYMVPSSFNSITDIPLTANGKLNRKALAVPDIETLDEYTPASTETEHCLAEIWQQVLAKQQIGIHDNFFRIGGDSILAIRVIAKAKAAGLNFYVSDLLAKPTIAELSKLDGQEQRIETYQPFSVISHQDASLFASPQDRTLVDAYPASLMQTAMLLESVRQSGTYHDVFNYYINAHFDLAKLEAVIAELTEQHEVFRTAFFDNEEYGFMAAVYDSVDTTIDVLTQDISVDELIAHEHGRFFEFSTPGLFRFIVSKVGDSGFRLTFSFHHALMDGWSVANMMKQLTDLYQSVEPIEKGVQLHYGQYIQNELAAINNESLTQFWQSYLAGYQLPEYGLSSRTSGQALAYQYSLSESESAGILALSAQLGVSVDTVFLTLFHSTMCLMYGCDDLAIALVVNNRLEQDGGDSQLGLFLNTVPLRATFDKTETDIRTHINNIAKHKGEVLAHKHLPLSHIKSLWDDQQVLFDCIFNYVHFHMFDEQSQAAPVLEGEQSFERTDIPVSLTVARHQDQLTLSLSANENHISATCFNQIKAYLIASVARANSTQAKSLFELTDADNLLLKNWNNTDVQYPAVSTLHQCFEQQANSEPEAIALHFDGASMTYRQLNEKANQLAHMIQSHQQQKADGKDAEPLVALYLERGFDMVVAMLAVLKAGAAYVPISTAYPSERTDFILSDTKASLVITHGMHRQRFIHQCDTVEVDDEQTLALYQTTNLGKSVQSSHLAYVIYTSGTSGKPKGVMVEHKNALHLVQAQTKAFDADKCQRALQFASYVFDASVSEIFVSLLNGHELFICTEQERLDTQALSLLIESNGIELATIPPIVLAQIETQVMASVKSLVSAGEVPSESILDRFSQVCQVINAYGPTEISVCATAHRYQVGDLNTNIGLALDNVKLYVLDKQLNPVPVGSVGELYIAGAGVARGYLNRAELTAERFIDNPFTDAFDKGEGENRIYKTGDIVRRLADGCLEYLGRNDAQIKIRGHRIEPSEISHVIEQFSAVNQAIVIDKGEGTHKYLAAYVVLASDKDYQLAELQAFLAERLADYMLPSAITVLDEVPLTINGKLDIRRLPEPDLVANNQYVAPRNELESQLCQIWQDVLVVEQVGIEDNFFGIGGNSITAVKLTAACRKELGMELSLTMLFEHKTIAAIAANLDSQPTIVIPAYQQDDYPLSFAQERLLFIERFEQGSSAYHIPAFFKLKDDINWSALISAFEYIAQRHKVLKTVYKTDSQGVDYPSVVNHQVTVADKFLAEHEDLFTAVQQEITKPFDLSGEMPMRLVRYVAKGQAYLLILWHHIAFDGWSTDIFLSELAQAYQAASNGEAINLIEPEISYADYAKWQREYLQGEVLQNQLDYWQGALSGYETLSLPTDKTRNKESDYRGNDLHFTLSEGLSNQLRILAKSEQTTLYTVLLSGFYITLANISGQSDIVVGTPADNRHHAQTQSLIGFFINSLALRAQVDDDTLVSAFIQQVHRVVTSAKQNQDVPFEKLVDLLKVEREPSRHPIFQVLFSVQHFGENEADQSLLPFIEQAFSSDDALYSPAKFDLSLFLDDGHQQISGMFNYAIGLFDKATIERFKHAFEHVLVKMVEQTRSPIYQISELPDSQRDYLLNHFNNNDVARENRFTLAQQFEQQVSANPDQIALVCGSEPLSYQALNQQANQLAHHIKALYLANSGTDIKGDTLIGLYFDRGIDMMVSMIAVLKAGAAYVPISPDYPEQRSQFILSDTDTRLVLTNDKYVDVLERLSKPAVDILSVDKKAILDTYSEENPQASNALSDLAYVIYTSGTTGKPKGVMIEQQNVNHYLQVINQTLPSAFNNIDFSSNYCFDLSVTTTLCPLMSGQCIYIYQGDISDIEAYQHHLEQHPINFIKTTPSIAHLALAQSNLFVETLMLGGEALSTTHLADLSAHTKQIFDEYGPTETTVGAMISQVHPPLDKGIGKGYPNVKLYNLNDRLQLVPLGTPGELYIAGAGLARGYLNRPALTAERFIDNHLMNARDELHGYSRLYKTGDIVRFCPDDNEGVGHVEYMGRNDSQVKIRGYRVELLEIEQVLATHPAINQAVVTTYGSEGKQGVAAYYLADDANELTHNELTAFMTTHLAEYMVPSHFIKIDSIPLTVNGKIDFSALPEPILLSEDTYLEASNELEEKLVGIWQTLLGLEKIGVQDNFFRIGGDSILSIQLVSRLRKAGYQLQVRDIFNAPTIAQLSNLLSTTNNTQAIEAEQGLLSGSFDLHPVQQWFFERGLAKENHWNQAFSLAIPNQLTQLALEQALNKLIHQHDMLRCTFERSSSGQVLQQYHDYSAELVAQVSLVSIAGMDSTAIQQRLTELQNDFDITDGPLWRAVRLTGFTDGHDRLFLAFHHLIIDTVSWRIIADDLRDFVEGVDLPEKTSSYRQWVGFLNEYAENYPQETRYWQSVLTKQVDTWLVAGATPNSHQFSLSNELSEQLLQHANNAFNTEINDLLLSALSRALTQTFKRSECVITLEGHGRESLNESLDVSRTVGWFTTMYPVELVHYQDNADLIIQTKEMLRQIPNKGVGYGALKKQGVLDAAYTTKVCFNYLGQINSVSQEALSDWQISAEQTGEHSARENRDNFIININGAIIDGRLGFKLDTQIATAQASQLAAAFEQALSEIITYASDKAALGTESTPSDYAVDNLSLTHLRKLQTNYEIEAIYPATSLQQGFIYHYLSQPDDDAYRVQVLLDYDYPLDINLYQQAWAAASLRFPILRTCFDWQDDALQIITANCSITEANFNFVDISELNESEREQAIIDIQQQDRQVAFDLSQPGLLRFTIIKQSASSYTVLKSEHHSIGDGWSGAILLEVVHDNYQQLSKQSTILPVVDKAYVAAQEHYQQENQATKDYWLRTTNQFTQVNDINLLFSQPINLNQPIEVNTPAEQKLVISGCDYQSIKAMCRNIGVTTNAALQFAWHKLIQIYTQDEQTIVGTTVSGRDIPIEGIEQSVGLYINTLPLAVNWHSTDSCADVLQGIQRNIADINSYSAIPLSQLQQKGERLFHSLFVFENYPQQTNVESASGISSSVSLRQVIEKVDYAISIIAFEQADSLIVEMKYGQEWLAQSHSQMLLEKLALILQSISSDVDSAQQSVSAVVAKEQDQLLRVFNDAELNAIDKLPLDKQFEAQADKTPEHIALRCQSQQLTYRELNQQAEQLAMVIRAEFKNKNGFEMPKQSLVALYFDRSIEMCIAMLAVLKAGAAYVPLSPTHPEERIEFMLADSAAELVLTQSHHIDSLQALCQNTQQAPCIIDTNKKSQVTCALEASNDANSLAYVIYTSGTTGKPKGVLVEHQSLSNLIASQTAAFEFTQDEVAILLAPYIFDASVESIWLPLLNGAELIIPTESQVQSVDVIKHVIAQQGVTHVLASASYLQALGQVEQAHAIKRVITGGEVCSAQLKAIWGDKLVNEYGPTETTVTALSCIDYHRQDALNIIGKPLKNVQALVLDAGLNLLPVGAVGELYIGGAGVTRGYLNQQQLTEERFIKNPYALCSEYETMYKTGDLVCWTASGQLKFIGRKDSQVKMRGYRIELAEIELAINEMSDICQAVVVIKEQPSHQYLAAYCVFEQLAMDHSQRVKDFLASKLPSYMVPERIVAIDKIPLTPNGKLDETALNALDDELELAHRLVVNTETEQALAGLWSDILSVPVSDIFASDNFFTLGGHSLLLVKLRNQIREQFDIEMTISELTQIQSLRALAEVIDKNALLKIVVNNDSETDGSGEFEEFEI